MVIKLRHVRRWRTRRKNRIGMLIDRTWSKIDSHDSAVFQSLKHEPPQFAELLFAILFANSRRFSLDGHTPIPKVVCQSAVSRAVSPLVPNNFNTDGICTGDLTGC